jgi:hypothetical protein
MVSLAPVAHKARVAQPFVVVPQPQWLNQYRFIDVGRFVL